MCDKLSHCDSLSQKEGDRAKRNIFSIAGGKTKKAD